MYTDCLPILIYMQQYQGFRGCGKEGVQELEEGYRIAYAMEAVKNTSKKTTMAFFVRPFNIALLSRMTDEI